MSDEDKSNNSICEKSMKMVVNIIRLSSFSIAKMGLGATGYSVVPKGLGPVTESFTVPSGPFPSQVPGSQRSQEPQSRSKAVSFLMPPTEGDGSFVVHEESSIINGKASAYIKKVHEKNRKAVHETPEPGPDIILPPPPRTAR